MKSLHISLLTALLLWHAKGIHPCGADFDPGWWHTIRKEGKEASFCHSLLAGLGAGRETLQGKYPHVYRVVTLSHPRSSAVCVTYTNLYAGLFCMICIFILLAWIPLGGIKWGGGEENPDPEKSGLDSKHITP